MYKGRFRRQLKQSTLCLFCILCIFICIKGAATNRATRLDSLKDILSHSPSPDVAIKTLQELSDLYRQKPEEVGYLHQLLDISNRVDSVQVVYTTAAHLSRYYYDEQKFLRSTKTKRSERSDVRKLFHQLNQAKESLILVIKENPAVYETLLDLLQ